MSDFEKLLNEYFAKLECIINKNDLEDPDLVDSYYKIGNLYFILNDYKNTLKYYFKSLEVSLSQLGNDHLNMIRCYNNIGLVYSKKGDYDKALEYYFLSLDLSLIKFGNDHSEVAKSYNNIGVAYTKKGDYDNSIKYHLMSLKICLENFGNQHLHVAHGYLNLGNVYSRKSDYDNAIKNYFNALNIYLTKIENNHSIIATTYNNLGLVYSNQGDYDKAFEFYLKSLNISLSKLGNNHPEVATTYQNIGSLYSRKQDFDNAILFYKKSYNINKKYDNYESISSILSIGYYYLKNKNFQKAKVICKHCIKSINKVFENNFVHIVFYNDVYFQIYYFYIYLNIILQKLSETFKAFETIRTIGFLNRILIKTAASVDGISSHDNEKILKLYDEIILINHKIENETKKTEVNIKKINILINNKHKLEKEFYILNKKLLKIEKYKNLRELKIATLKEAKGLCNKDTAILEYIIWEDKEEKKSSYCILIKKKEVKIFKIDWDNECSEYTKNLKPGDDNKIEFINKKSFVLYSRLIAPLEEDLRGIKELIISPDGPLAFLPFDVLRKNIDSLFFCEQFMLSLVPSISVMKMIKERNYIEDRDFFIGFGNIKYSEDANGQNRGNNEPQEFSDKFIEYHEDRFRKYGISSYRDAVNEYLPNLPWTKEEIREIAWNVFDNQNSKIFESDEASEKTVKELSKNKILSNYKYIHFACHGKFDEYLPQNSSVILSEYLKKNSNEKEDGHLDVNDVAILNLNADLVTLSACRTGLGKIVRGDGIVGLTRAFHVAGANNVLATIWKIEDKSTKDFMVSFYNKVHKEKLPIKKALQKTKLEYIKNNQNPFYWAGFVLWGA